MNGKKDLSKRITTFSIDSCVESLKHFKTQVVRWFKSWSQRQRRRFTYVYSI
jgi:hypothetical protein